MFDALLEHILLEDFGICVYERSGITILLKLKEIDKRLDSFTLAEEIVKCLAVYEVVFLEPKLK